MTIADERKAGWLRYKIDGNGVRWSVHLCEHCWTEYAVCPAFPPEETREVSRTCTRPSCPSYRPGLDLDLTLFGITHHAGAEKPGSVEYLAAVKRVPRPTVLIIPNEEPNANDN